MGACTHIKKKMKKKNWTSSPDTPRWGFFYLPEFQQSLSPTPIHTRALKGLTETLAAFPPPSWLGPKAGLISQQLTGACRRLRAPPPPVLQPGGSLHACLDRSITGTPTTPARAQRPCPGLPARTVPDGQRPKPGERDRDCVGGRRGALPTPRAHRGSSPAPSPRRSRQPGCQGTVTALRAGQSYFYLV